MLTVLTVAVLLVGVFSAVGLSLQNQDSRSHASGYTSYGNYYSVSNSSGGFSSILCIFLGGCSNSGGGTSYQPTPVPCGYTQTTSYNNQNNNTYNSYRQPTATPTPRPCPTATPVPYYAPTATPAPYYAPTATPAPYQPTVPPYGGSNATANVTVYLHGIGNGGDNVNPSSQGNMTPQHTSRVVDVQIFNAANQLVTDNQATVNYDSGAGNFVGQTSLGAIESGPYTVKIKTDQFLRGQLAGIQTLTTGQTVSLPAIKLVAGDVNSDNQINILDYNILIGCYSDLSPAVSCNTQTNLMSDINDDGHVNQYDYNLFIRELSNLNGQ
jgi:hypothetical protein